MDTEDIETLSTDSTIIMVNHKPLCDPIPQQKAVKRVQEFIDAENLEVVNVSRSRFIF